MGEWAIRLRTLLSNTDDHFDDLGAASERESPLAGARVGGAEGRRSSSSRSLPAFVILARSDVCTELRAFPPASPC